jgi:hypothetical protein
VALPFVHVEGGLAPGEAIECPYEATAIRRAEAMARNEAIAVAERSPGAETPMSASSKKRLAAQPAKDNKRP